MRSTAANGNTSSASARRSVGTRADSATTGRSFRQGASEGSGKLASGGRASGRGFNAYKSAAKDSKKFDSDYFKVDYDKTYVVAFLEAENYDFVFRHDLENVPNDEGGFWKYVPRNCIADPDNDVTCPICGVGDDPKPLALFNVVDLDQPGKVLAWEASKGIFDKIVELAESLAQVPEDRGGPLDLNSPGVYVSVSKKKKETKTGRGGFTEYTVARVKERDLDEDHSLDPVSDEQMAELLTKLKTSDDIQFNTSEELTALAARLED